MKNDEYLSNPKNEDDDTKQGTGSDMQDDDLDLTKQALNTVPPSSRTQISSRESINNDIRRRVRSAKASENAIFMPAKPNPTIADLSNKAVAVYARVSTKSTEQVSSIENQTKYYTEKIKQSPHWEMQEIYSESKSGTSIKKRTEFQRMLRDAKDMKMDLILCASVSRFARNVADCIEQVRLLKTMNPLHPIGVFFETENLYTLDPDSNQRLSIHAMLAGWESATRSGRMIISYNQRICTGQYPVLDLLGYRHTIDGKLIIQQDEALTVRFIFLAFICGYSYQQIADVLTQKERKTLNGRTDWNTGMVRNIMSNERRWGDLHARKTVVIDYAEHIVVKNDNIRDAAFVPNHHEGIVTPQIARAAHLVAASGKGLKNGVPQMRVIDKGSLKGFVSICPSWSGVDDEAFQEVTRSVYNAQEYEVVGQEAKILSGNAHSNVEYMQFSQYEVPYGVFFINRNTPTLTISPKSICFNSASHNKLKHSQYVEILYHPVLKTIAIRACDINHPNAIVWESSGREIMTLHTNAFTDAIYERTTWNRYYRFRFRGVPRERNHSMIIFFFLDEPQILLGKKARKHHCDDPGTQTKHISYTEGTSDMERLKKGELVYAYPDAWNQNRMGISYQLHRRRDQLINTISRADITEIGIEVENPLVGSIPSQTEVMEELDQLLLSM